MRLATLVRASNKRLQTRLLRIKIDSAQSSPANMYAQECCEPEAKGEKKEHVTVPECTILIILFFLL